MFTIQQPPNTRKRKRDENKRRHHYFCAIFVFIHQFVVCQTLRDFERNNQNAYISNKKRIQQQEEKKNSKTNNENRNKKSFKCGLEVIVSN